MSEEDKSNLWGDMAAISGLFKTPVIKDAMEFLEQFGIDLERDSKKARTLCETKAYSGDLIAKYILACLYAYGIGGEQDSELAEKLCRESASNGNVRASLLLASLLISAKKSTEDNIKEANNILIEASGAGDLDARYSIALLALNGIGRESDREFAVKEFEYLISNGYKDAQCVLATELFKEGTPEAEKRAVDLIIDAGNRDDPLANYLLSNFYLSGIHGFPRDEQKAQFYVEKISKKNN